MADFLVHTEWIRKLALRLLGDPVDAEDVVQEALRIAGEKPPRRSDNLAAWLTRVTQHLVFRRLRSAERRARRERLAALAHYKNTAAPDELAMHAETQRQLLDAVLALKEPYQKIILMYFYQERSYEQIATELDRPISTVRVQTSRGLKLLHSKLGSAFPEWKSKCILLLGLTPLRLEAVFGPSHQLPTQSSAVKQGPSAVHMYLMKAFAAVVALASFVALTEVVVESSNQGDEAQRSMQAQRRSNMSESAEGGQGEANSVAIRRDVTTLGVGHSDGQQESSSSPREVSVRFTTPEGARLFEAVSEVAGFKPSHVAAIATAQPPSQVELHVIVDRSLSTYGVGKFVRRTSQGANEEASDPECPDPAQAIDESEVDGVLQALESDGFYLTPTFGNRRIGPTIYVNSHQDEVELVADPGAIRGSLASVTCRVTSNASGTPCKGAQVIAIFSNSILRTRSGVDGLATLHVPPGRLALHLVLEDVGANLVSVMAVPGETVALGDLQLEPLTTIEGILRDASNRPIRGKLVHAMPLEGLGFPFTLLPGQGRSAVTSKSGEFSIDLPAIGSYVVMPEPSSEWARLATIVDPASEASDWLELKLGVGSSVRFRADWPNTVLRFVMITQTSGTEIPLFGEVVLGGKSWTVMLSPEQTYRVDVADSSGLLYSKALLSELVTEEVWLR